MRRVHEHGLHAVVHHSTHAKEILHMAEETAPRAATAAPKGAPPPSVKIDVSRRITRDPLWWGGY